jgi:hypothetical protein
VRSFGPLDLYETDVPRSGEVYAGVPLLGAGAEPSAIYRAIRIGPNVASVGPGGEASLNGVAEGEIRLVHAARERGPATVTLTKTAVVVAFTRGGKRTALRFPRVSPPFRAIVGTRSFVVTRAHPSISLPADALAKAPTLFRFLGGSTPVSVPIPSQLPERLGDCYRYDSRTPIEAGLTAEVVRRDGIPTARLGARDHAACVSLPVKNNAGRAPLRIQFAYRSVSGSPARICLWQVEPRRCAPLPALLAFPGWHSFDASVAPKAGTRSLRLFLYADGDSLARTVTEYRQIRIERARPVVALGVAPLAQLPRVSYRRVAPYEFRVRVDGARRPFLLAVDETFAPGWHLETGGRDSTGLTHVRVNGYANGWRVPWKGSYDLTVTYGPEQLARWAGRIDLVLVLLVAAVWLVRVAWRRPRFGASDGARSSTSAQTSR